MCAFFFFIYLLIVFISVRADIDILSNVRVDDRLAVCVCGRTIGRLCHDSRTLLLFNTRVRHDLVDPSDFDEIQDVFDNVVRVSSTQKENLFSFFYPKKKKKI